MGAPVATGEATGGGVCWAAMGGLLLTGGGGGDTGGDMKGGAGMPDGRTVGIVPEPLEFEEDNDCGRFFVTGTTIAMRNSTVATATARPMA